MKTGKKILSMFLVVLMLLTSVPLSGFATQEESQTGRGVPWDGSTKTVAEFNEDKTEVKITSAENLAWFSSVVNSGNDFSAITVNLGSDIDLGGYEWTPIGKTMTTAFKGIFKGNGHTIGNYKISISINSGNIVDAPYHAAGLFGACSNAQISDLTIENSSVTIKNESGYQNSYSSIDGTSVFAGALCGYASNVVFDNVSVTNGNITVYTGAEAGDAYAGGICGYIKSPLTISNCSINSGSITGTSDSTAGGNAYTGGLIGCAVNDGTIRQCMNAASVSGGHSTGAAYTGGIVGKTESSTTTLSLITDCYNTGKVTHTGSWLESGGVGGIAGFAASSIMNCYNSGSVIASTNTVGGSVFVGGIVGTGSSTSVISNSAVISSQISGGTSNYIISSIGSKNNNIASDSISGSPTNDADVQHKLNDFYSMSTYEQLGWDFGNVWAIAENGYPFLLSKDNETESTIKAVLEAITNLNITFAKNDTYNRVTQNITLPKSASYTDAKGEKNNIDVVWSSTNSTIVSVPDGTVSRLSSDSLVKIMAKITLGEYTRTKIFTLNVLGYDTPSECEAAYWGMNIDDARELISLIRGCKFKNVSVDDQDVLVLIGADTDESHVIDTVAKVMEFYEIPSESGYLRSKLGDVVGLIKSGQDAEYSALLKDFSDGLVKYDSKDSEAEINKEKVASKLLAIPNAAFDVKTNMVDVYSKAKSLNGISFNTKDDIVDQSLSNGKKLAGIMDFVVKTGGGSFTKSSEVFGAIQNCYDLWQLAKAYGVAKQNATKSYLKMYLENRDNYTSPEDETFQLIMEAHKLTSIKGDIENIDEIAETIYFLNKKFCGTEDKYQIIIQCPVDVNIYDSNGTIVGRVVDNVVDTSIKNSLKITVGGKNNDEKTIYIQDEEEYSLQLIGNDVGNMDVTIGYENGSKAYKSIFSDIKLETGKTMITSISLSDIENNDIQDICQVVDGVVTEDSETLDSTSRNFLFDAQEVTSYLNGTCEVSTVGGETSDGYIAAGTLLNKLSQSKFGFAFAGYYTDADCTIKYAENYMPEENVLIYAKYVEVDVEIEFTTQPVSTNYRQGDTPSPLCVSVNCPENYSTGYQWYIIKSDGTEKLIENATDFLYTPSTVETGTSSYYVVVTAINLTTGKRLVSRSEIAMINVTKYLIIGSGNCGNNLNWTVYENNELVIDGVGEMTEWDSASNVPWKSYIDKVRNIVINEGVTSISSYAFDKANKVKSIVVPKSVEKIGEYAFSNCSSLEDITIPFIGSSRDVASTYDAVFGYIFGRATTSETGGVIQYYNLSESTLKGYTYNIPTTLKKVVISDAKTIPFGAFYNCNTIKEISINSGVESISDYAFCNCESLTTFEIPNTVKSVNEHILSGCNNISKLTIPFIGSSRTSNNTFDSVIGYVFGRTSQDKGIAQYCTIEGSSISYYYYAIPSSLKEVIITDATQIPFGAFCNCSNLTNVVINDTVESINKYSFYNCTGLTEISIPNSVTSIAEGALEGCNSLESLTIPFVGSSRDANNTYDAVFGHIFGRTSQDDGIVQYCTLNGTSISYYYYAVPSSLKYVSITNASQIPFGAFCNCSDIKKITLNKEISAIGGYSFYNCSALDEIYLSDNVDTIGSNAFSDCSSLSKIEIRNKNCTIYNSSATIPSVATIYGYKNSTANSYATTYSRKFVALDDIHTHAYTSTVTAPTCTDKGFTTYTCSECGDTYTGNETPALGHTGGKATCKALAVCTTCGKTYGKLDSTNHANIVTDKAVAATCSKTGLTEGSHCKDCGEVIIAQTETAKIDHKYGSVTTDPTCTDNGYTTYTCTECGDTYTGNETPSLGHTGGKATCKALAVCTTCGKTYGKLDSTNHANIVTDKAVDATCSKTGLTEGSHCKDCGEVIVAQTETAKIDHKYGSTVTSPTCTDNGYTTYTCTECGDTYTGNETPSLGHTGGKATCKALAVCTTCGKTYGKLDSTNHANIVTDKAVDATCSKTGLTEGSHCKDCGEVIVAQTQTAKIDHKYGSTVTSPTCTDNGYTTYTCSVCGDTYTANETPLLGHNMSAFTTTKSPTCTEKGTSTATCSRCDYVETKDISATGHNFQDGKCTNCGETKSCSCNCHKSGFMGFIWKIQRFFYKIFKTHKTCDCGVVHY